MTFILGVRTDKPEATLILAHAGGEVLEQLDWLAGRELSVELLAKIEELMSRHQASWEDLSGIVVFEGPGSFTGLRIGLTVANTAAFTLGIPIVGSTDDDWFASGIKKITSDKFTSIVMPLYGGEANVTKPKK
jgi:tRNA threonylcarbamoyladenosine biosynthesis protein TsaB